MAHFAEFDRSRIAYVGDSVTMDIAASSAAGLHPILLDPYDDHAERALRAAQAMHRRQAAVDADWATQGWLDHSAGVPVGGWNFNLGVATPITDLRVPAVV